jgi:hypothetical protein
LGCAGLKELVVADAPDFPRIHGGRVAAVVARRDAVESEPVTFHLQCDDLLAAVGRGVHDLDEAGVQHMQVHEPVAGAIEGVTSAQDAPLDGHLLCQELEDVARRLGWMRSIEWEASGAGGAGRLRCAGQVHADVPSGWMKFSLGVRREPSRNATRRCATLGKRIVTGRLL